MIGLLKISEASNLAIHSMAYLASQKRTFSVAEISKHLNVSSAHLYKVLQKLVRLNFLSSTRGLNGGYLLTTDPKKLSLLDLIVAVDGPYYRQGCLLGRAICRPGTCVLGDPGRTVTNYFKKTTIHDFKMKQGRSRPASREEIHDRR